jgi:hypothetical protein
MEIVAALFLDDVQTRQVPGPATRLDLSGVQFSAPAPGPVPVTLEPHLMVLVWNRPGGDTLGALETRFLREGEQIARNLQAFEVEPGRFSYRLVRAQLPFDDYGTVVAECRMGAGPVHVVPFTLLPPV